MKIQEVIVVEGKNGIIEKGNHDELMKLNGVYANMYNASNYQN